MNFENNNSPATNSLSKSLANLEFPGWEQFIVPDLWQQQAITALKGGKDVVVQAPTGAGKTLIFEQWSKLGKNNAQAIYTVPTRALANDKLAEWRTRGWNVGIATGDLSENLDAPIIVATLETQKLRLIKGEGPSLLVIDEYQMIRDSDRGLNYELALAMAPIHTQLLLLSGSVSNPHDIIKWFTRLGREAVLIKTTQRPVPLEEVLVENIHHGIPSSIRGFWPRLVAKALAEELGSLLIFAPRRVEAEKLAAEIARYLPNPNPLYLTPEQKRCVGNNLAQMLKTRVIYHHSGLSYAARAGVIEPLTKAGQLRVVVATMGLAAGINFSLRTVALAADSYKRNGIEHPISPDEILQMFGRAGRRGIDKTGYVLTSEKGIRLNEGYPCRLSRSKSIDWSTLLSVMQVAVETGREPFHEALSVQKRLFTSNLVPLGIEESLSYPNVTCGLNTDTERARHIRKPYRQILNSRGEWQPTPFPQEIPLKEIFVTSFSQQMKTGKPQPKLDSTGKPILIPALTHRLAVEKVGIGNLCNIILTQQNQTPIPDDKPNIKSTTLSKTEQILDSNQDSPSVESEVPLSETFSSPPNLQTHSIYGRLLTIAEIYDGGNIYLVKYIRRLINWSGRQVKPGTWKSRLIPRIKDAFLQQKINILKIEKRINKIIAFLDISNIPISCYIDQHGIPLFKPAIKEGIPPECEQCECKSICRKLTTSPGAVLLWRRLGLITPSGVPTMRGRIASFFSGGPGLAIAAAIEDEEYPLKELIYDLANLDAGFRFAGDENRWAGRLAWVCKKLYNSQTAPGYLEYGVPPEYGFGAAEVIATLQHNPEMKSKFITPSLGIGDIDRIIIEWRSRLRQIAHAPALENSRWTELQKLCKTTLNELDSPTARELPPLEFNQTRRIEHTLFFKKH